MDTTQSRLTRRAFIGGVGATCALSLAVPSLAFADPTSAEKQAEADSVRTKVASMQDELNKASQDYYAALDEHDAAEAAKDDAQARIDEATEQILGCQDKLGSRVNSMYRTGNTSFLDILLGSATFEEFVSNWDILDQMNEKDADLVQQTKGLRTQIEEQKAEYQRQEEIAQQKADEAKRIKDGVESTVASLQQELDSLDAEARELLLREQEQAAAAARAQEVAQQAAAPTGGTGGGTQGGSGSGSGGGSWSGGDYPANGSVVSYAQYCLGTPYVWGGNTPGAGLDCSGLTYWCYQQVGITIPRTTYGMPGAAKWQGPVSAAQPGDVLWNYEHAAICVAAGGGTYIHAPQEGDVVRYSSWPQFELALRF